MYEFRKSSFIIIAIQSSPSQRTNLGNQKMAAEADTIGIIYIENDTKFCKNLFYDNHGERS
jgi:hypothetical protein